MPEIVGHLVDEVGRTLTVYRGVTNKLLTQCAKLLALQFLKNIGISVVRSELFATAEFMRHGQDVG